MFFQSWSHLICILLFLKIMQQSLHQNSTIALNMWLMTAGPVLYFFCLNNFYSVLGNIWYI